MYKKDLNTGMISDSYQEASRSEIQSQTIPHDVVEDLRRFNVLALLSDYNTQLNFFFYNKLLWNL